MWMGSIGGSIGRGKKGATAVAQVSIPPSSSGIDVALSAGVGS